ncbi:zinc-dependent alcohol dehydrogenase [Bradyrhizobium betae]|uniref:Alcohol dehydrogenase-like C-terminal domain-containing protein n=1 Tax=Bradyrhizobium betae TaxID=244734 RepID=A0A4Q1VU29_9BRAD|nr:zinc-binding alcohol dehydrogenase [Bradyrhizobium betae]RXT54254.1 hypothetical protein B5V03_02100 [Bradyrhizobium betae]
MTKSQETIRSVWFEAPRTASLREETLSEISEREVRVRAIHSLISAGTELNMYRGQGNLPEQFLASMQTMRGKLPFPIKFGYQVVGEIVDAGRLSGFSIGDKVFTVHPHQNLFNIETGGRFVRKIPDGVSLQHAQFTTMFGVALQTFLQRPVRPGEVVAVSGLGLIGAFSGYLSRLSAGRLILIEPLASRRRRSAWVGADSVVAPEEAKQAIADLSGGRGADLFIETSGAPAALQTAIDNTAALGTIAVPAWYGTRPVTLSLSPDFHLKSLKIISIHVSNLDEDKRWDAERKFLTSVDYLSKIDVERFLSHRIPFAEAPQAYDLIDKNPDETYSILLEY